MIKLRFQLTGLDATISRLQPNRLYKHPIGQAMADLSQFGAEVAKGRAPRDLAVLANGIMSEAHDNMAKVYVPMDSPAAAYADVMEHGRFPGAKMPPPNALRGWANRHGFENTFVLARAVARRGIKGRFFMREAYQRMQQKAPEVLKRAAREIEANWRRR